MPLLRKELRGLAPLALLVLTVVALLDLVYEPLTSRLDEIAWAGFATHLRPGEGDVPAILYMILGLVVAYSLLPREHDEGTIELLYSLPVSRARIFAAKALAGLLVLLGGVVGWQLVAWLLQAQNPQSFSGEQWRLGTAAGVVFLHGAYCGVVLCHGLLISFLRKLGLLVYAVVAWGVVTLKDIRPGAAWLDPTELVALEYHAARLVLPWRELGWQAAIALGCLALAYLLWMGRGERFSALYARFGEHPLGRLVLGCATLLLLVAGALWFAYFVGSEDGVGDRDPDAPPALEERFPALRYVHVETEHFDFTYPASLRERALRLIERAEETYAGVRGALGAERAPRIAADLSFTGGHLAGIAAWETLRVDIARSADDAELLRTFHHETVHAFQFAESDRRINDDPDATAFFVEGLAEYLALEAVPDPDARRASRRAALAAWHHQRVRFDLLADRSALGARHDPNLVYALGELWSAALVEACGPEAPGALLRAMAREGAPRGLPPLAFWQDTLQASGYGLEAVVGRWERLLAELREDERAWLEQLPRLGGGVARVEDDTLVVVAIGDEAPPSLNPDQDALRRVDALRLRVRSHAGVSDDAIRTFTGQPAAGPGSPRVEFRVPRALLTGRTFELQFGISLHPEVWPYYQAWQSAPIPR